MSTMTTFGGATKRKSAIVLEKTLVKEVPLKKPHLKNANVSDGVTEARQTMTLTNQFDSKVRPFIDLVDDLRQYGLEKDISLPSIVVIGDQSSGKSSILEAISGVQLPRGSGIVTRCPLEMKLKRSHDAQSIWRASMHYLTAIGNEINIDVKAPEKLESMIQKAQEEIAGNNNGISENLISLVITSHSCPDLTLIDLPGIARTAVDGQPVNICEQIKALLRKYIRNPQTIILCVIAANVDIAVNEALSLAKQHDENGIRTLGVLTKPDLVDRGAENDILAILNNEKYYLKKGYSIVRCRGQQEINDGSTLSDALNEEQMFFSQHPQFRNLPDYQRGVKQLAIKLTDNLVEHIQRTLPKLHDDVEQKLKNTSMMLADLGVALPGDNAGKRAHLMKMINNVIGSVEKIIIKGDQVPRSAIESSKGRRISELKNLSDVEKINSSWGWRHRFMNLRSRITNYTSEQTSRKLHVNNLQRALDVFRGRELQPFLNFELFESVVRDHISNYERFLSQCLEDINKDTYALVLYVCKEHLQTLPNVLDKVKCVIESSRAESLEQGLKLLELEMEKEQLVFVQDQTFSEEIAKRHERVRVQSTGRSMVDPNDLQELLHDYMTIANRRICDNVPMLIRTTQHYQHFKLLTEQLHSLAAEDGVEKIVREDYKLESTRQNLQARRQRLTTAMRRLAESQEIGIDITSFRGDL